MHTCDSSSVFWNEANKSYSDWIETAGNKRNYFYVDIAFTAILAGVVSGMACWVVGG